MQNSKQGLEVSTYMFVWDLYANLTLRTRLASRIEKLHCLMSVCQPNSTSSHTRLASRIEKLHCLSSVCQPNPTLWHTRLAPRNTNLTYRFKTTKQWSDSYEGQEPLSLYYLIHSKEKICQKHTKSIRNAKL